MYCRHCGNQNQDDAQYCKKCGKPLHQRNISEKDWENRCEQECTRGSTSFISLIWGVIIIIIGLWVIFTILSITIILFFALIPVIIVIFTIIFGVKIFTQK